jgi:hypothetical protein
VTAPTTPIACERCGRVTTLPAFVASLAGASFTCGGCGHVHSFGGEKAPDPMLAAVASALGATVKGSCAIVPTRPYDVQISIDFSSGTPMGLSLHARTRPLPDVTFTIESSLDRTGRAIGLTREVQLGDASFDPHVWVDSSIPDEVVHGLLRAPEVRRAIVAILHSGHRQPNVIPSIDVKMCEAGVLASIGLSALDDIAGLKALVECVATIARTIVPPATKVAPVRTPPRVAAIFILAVVLGVAAIPSCVAGSMHPPLIAHYAPVVYGILGGLVAWLAVMPLFAFLVRGRSSSMTTLLFAGFVWLLVLGFFGAALAPLLNWALDDSPVEEHRATVVSIEQLTSDDDAVYYRVTLQSWKDPADTFTLSRGEPGTLAPGKKVLVRTHRGRFGWHWLVP